MRVDQDKIRARIEKLNEGLSDKPWLEVIGYNMFPQVNIDTEPPTVLPNNGIFVKIFVHRDTGELRVYPIVIFAPEGDK